MKKLLSISSVAVLALCVQAQAASVDVQFNLEGLQTQVVQDPASNQHAKGFDTKFTGSLLTTSNFRGSQFSVSDSSLGDGWSLTGFFASQSFSNGSLIGGELSLTAVHADGYTDSLSASLLSNRGGQSIFQPANGSSGFIVATEIGDVSLSGFGALDNNFAGLDLSSAMAQDWLGSLLQFRFNPDAKGVDLTANVSMVISGVIIPLPTPILMALTGLLPVVIIGLRRRRLNRI